MADVHEIEVVSAGEMAFHSSVNGHQVVLDAKEEQGGHDLGPRPKPMLLVALAGCTGMDVVSLLKKMRADYSILKIAVSGELTDEHPKHYHHIHVIYRVGGMPEEAQAKMQKAVDLSLSKYCGVTFMLQQVARITHEIQHHE